MTKVSCELHLEYLLISSILKCFDTFQFMTVDKIFSILVNHFLTFISLFKSWYCDGIDKSKQPFFWLLRRIYLHQLKSSLYVMLFYLLYHFFHQKSKTTCTDLYLCNILQKKILFSFFDTIERCNLQILRWNLKVYLYRLISSTVV